MVLADNIFISDNVESLQNKIVEFLKLTDSELKQKKELQHNQFEKYEDAFNAKTQMSFKNLI